MGDQQIWVTRDFILSTRGNGHLDFVFLDQVEDVEVDRKDITYRAGDQNTRVVVRDELYTILFRYREDPSLDPKVRKFRGKDMKLSYPSRELRDRVIDALKTLHPETENA